MTTTRLPLVFLLLVLLGRAADAQRIVHDGVYGSVGVGAGSAQVECGRCAQLDSEDPLRGGVTPLTFYLGVGCSVRPNLLADVELDAWVKSR
jgi:hypothetical protein